LEIEMTLTGTGRDPLDDELLADFDGRAPVYDRHNAFFNEDFEDLRRRGAVGDDRPGGTRHIIQ
jgi:hypothetical protein